MPDLPEKHSFYGDGKHAFKNSRPNVLAFTV
jgi:hypothetical protein